MPSDQPTDASGARRPRLTPPIADVRRAVRSVLPSAPPFPEPAEGNSIEVLASTGSASGIGSASAWLVLVALSGGADSLALAAATAFEAPRLGLRAGAVIVDHGLQADSAHIAATAADQCRSLGLDPVEVRAVEIGTEGGPEGAARAARYDALRDAADALGADVVLLAH